MTVHLYGNAAVVTGVYRDKALKRVRPSTARSIHRHMGKSKRRMAVRRQPIHIDNALTVNSARSVVFQPEPGDFECASEFEFSAVMTFTRLCKFARNKRQAYRKTRSEPYQNKAVLPHIRLHCTTIP